LGVDKTDKRKRERVRKLNIAEGEKRIGEKRESKRSL
jgi:hypothetical protein